MLGLFRTCTASSPSCFQALYCKNISAYDTPFVCVAFHLSA